MRFGVREICNVTFKPLVKTDIGSQHFEAMQPCLYIDTATASNMEVATTTVYAQGGRGNARLIAWEGEKTATFTVTDALLSPVSLAMLSGAGVVDSDAKSKIVHKVYDTTVTSDGKIVIAGTYMGGTDGDKIIASTDSDYAKYRTYVTVTDESTGNISDYLGINEIGTVAQATDGTVTISAASGASFTKYAGQAARVDCYVKSHAATTTLTIDAENFGGTYYIEADTLFRDEATGSDFPATFIIPKGKVQGNFTFSMAASGDPSTFDFTIDCTLGTVLGQTEKSLFVIDIENTVSADAHTETATIDTSASNISSKASS